MSKPKHESRFVAACISDIRGISLSRSVQARFLFLNFFALVVLAFSARAQWQTQSFDLTNGWNAVFLHVDADYTTLDALIGGNPSNPIVEVWRWNPPATTQFTDSPSNPNAGSEWSNWMRSTPGGSLRRLGGDAAYLVRVVNVSNYLWEVKGRPVPPRPEWTVTGVNLIGFSTVPVNPPKFDAFLALAPELKAADMEMYRYPGGELGSGNPMKVPHTLFRSVSVKRGQAFWIRADETMFNQYFGPFEVKLNGTSVDFGDNLGAASVRLRNLTTNVLTVSLRLAASDDAPFAQPAVAGVPPLIIRGDFNVTNLVFGYTSLPVGATRTWILAPANTPGSEIEAVIGLNRAAITATPGELLAGILRFTDNLGFSQVDVGVSAKAASSAGLWVGGAVVGEVGQYLKSYSRDAANNLVVSSNGSYVVTNINTSLERAVRPYPLRLIVHNPASGNAALLQRVFVGLDANTNNILSLKETALSPLFLKDARRLSAAHLPWSSENTAWPFNGRFSSSTNLTTTVTLGYDDRASSPFLHTYHPAHDNLDRTFDTLLPQGSESYRVERQINLTVTPPGDDFSSLVSASQSLGGSYSEVVTLKGLARAGGTNDTRRFEVRGHFSLDRVSDIPQITPAP